MVSSSITQVLGQDELDVLRLHPSVRRVDPPSNDPPKFPYPWPIGVAAHGSNLKVPLAMPRTEVEGPAIVQPPPRLRRARPAEHLNREPLISHPTKLRDVPSASSLIGTSAVRHERAPSARTSCRRETMRIVTSEPWTCQHFSLANALDDRPTDLAHLLRRVADELDRQQIRPIELLDVTISSEVTADGPWWSATVYWSPGGEPG